MKTRAKYILMIPMLFAAAIASGQTTLHVLTKTINKEISAKAINELVVNAEQADVVVNSWDKESIGIIVKLIAKHPNKERAEKELPLMKFLNEKIGKTYYLRNYLLVKNGESKPSSNFTATYEINIPKRLKLNIKDSFGKVILVNLIEAVSLDLSFCTSELIQCKGSTAIKSYFGTNKIEDLNNLLELNTNHTESKVKNHIGNLSAQINNGSLYYDYEISSQNISIEANSANIILQAKELRKSEVELKLSKSKLEHSHLFPSFQKKGSQSSWKNKGKGQLKIDLEAGTLTIL
jgi:hypothetical protein